MDNFKKIIWWTFWMVTLLISCWATSESFHLLMPQWPMVAIWVFSIMFFVLASVAVGLITKAFQNDFLEHRKRIQCLIGGIVMLLAFWFFLSMPTNAHTFFYREKVGDIVSQDLSTTQSYLNQLANREVKNDSLYQNYLEIAQKVAKEKNLMINEFNGIGKSQGGRGNGKFVQDRLTKINNLIGCNIPIHPKYNSTDPSILNFYTSEIEKELAKLESSCYVSEDVAKTAKSKSGELQVFKDSIQDMVLVGSMATRAGEPVVQQAQGVLHLSYSYLKDNCDYVNFKEEDEPVYTAQNLETRTKAFLNPFKVVFYDFLRGVYPFSFFFFILLSILIDVAGFVFYALAIKENNNY